MKFLLIFMLLIFSGCSLEEKFELSSDYKYIRNYGSVHSIAIKQDNGMYGDGIWGDVIEVEENENFIIGRRIIADPKIDIPNGFEDQPYGYFFIDKKTKKIVMGLKKDQVENYKNLPKSNETNGGSLE